MSDRRPCWATVNDEALQPDALPRVLAAMAFDAYCGAIPRGTIAWWPPAYLRPLHGSLPHPESVAAAYRASYRARLAPINRAMRDADVVLLALHGRIVCVDTLGGEWRSADGANRGRDLIELGAWRWACRYGQAGHRIARLAGLAAVPTYRPETIQQVWAAIHARAQEAHGA